jgi:hypothetical protein
MYIAYACVMGTQIQHKFYVFQDKGNMKFMVDKTNFIRRQGDEREGKLTKQPLLLCRILSSIRNKIGKWYIYAIKKLPWSESASEPYRPSDRRLSAKLMSAFVDRGCHMVSVTDLFGCILGFLDRSSYFSFQVAPQLYSRG